MAARKVSGIYEIVNLINGNRYIGSARNMRVRWSQHRLQLKRGEHHSGPLQSAWRKYGIENFEFRIICECSPHDLVSVEQRYLDERRPAYNVAEAAGYRTFLGRKHSPETLAKMSEAHKGNTRTKGRPRDRTAVEATAAAHRGMKRSEETRKRIAEAAKGRKPPPRSAEYRAKLSAAMKARPYNAERVAKMAATKRGSTLTEAHKRAIGEASRRAWAARKAAKQ